MVSTTNSDTVDHGKCRLSDWGIIQLQKLDECEYISEPTPLYFFCFFFVRGWKFLNKEWNKSLLNHFIIIIYKRARPGYTQSLGIGKADEILWYSVIFLYFWTKPIRFERVLFELIPPWLSGRPEPCGGLSEYFITDPHLLSPWLIIFTLRLEIRNPGISAFALAPARGIVGRLIMDRILMAQ